MTVTTFAITSGANDGHLVNSGGSYPPAGTVSRDTAADHFTVRRSASFTIVVGFMLFDTSSIPDTDVISAATMELVPMSGDWTFDDGRDMVIEYATLAMTTADYTATASSTAHAGTLISTLTMDSVNSFTLQNLTSISKTGNTGFRVHVSGGQPTGANNVDVASFDHTTFQEPRLVVTHAAPAGGTTITDLVGMVTG